MKKIFYFMVCVTALLLSAEVAITYEDLHDVEVFKKHFENAQDFTNWYKELNAKDKNLVLAGAVYACYPDIVKTAIELGGDVNTKLFVASITSGHDEHGKNYLYTYNESDGNIDTVTAKAFADSMKRSQKAVKKESCGHEFSTFGAGTNGFIPLTSVAAKFCSGTKSIPIIKLLAKDDMINNTNEFHVSSLSEAIANNDIETVEYLLQNGADFSKTFALSKMIDQYYSYNADEKTNQMIDFVISYIQNHKLSPEAETDAYIQLTVNNDDELHQKLAVLNLQPDYTTLAAKDGLILAAARSHYDLVKELVEHGVDVNYQNNYGKTALFYLTDTQSPRQEDIEIVKYMLDHGADASLKDEKGKTAFDDCSYNICKLNPNGMRQIKPDDASIVPTLNSAIDNNDCETIAYFIKNGVDPYIKVYGNVLLFSLFNDNHRQCLEDILKIGIDLNRIIIDHNDIHTALTYANQYRFTKGAIPLLTQYGAKELDAEDQQKRLDYYNTYKKYRSLFTAFFHLKEGKKDELKLIKKDIEEKMNNGNLQDWETEVYNSLLSSINTHLSYDKDNRDDKVVDVF